MTDRRYRPDRWMPPAMGYYTLPLDDGKMRILQDALRRYFYHLSRERIRMGYPSRDEYGRRLKVLDDQDAIKLMLHELQAGRTMIRNAQETRRRSMRERMEESS